MRDQHAHIRIAREVIAQIVHHLGTGAAAPPIPARADLAVEQLIGLLDPPIEDMLVEIGHRGGERRARAIEHRVGKMRCWRGRIWIIAVIVGSYMLRPGLGRGRLRAGRYRCRPVRASRFTSADRVP